MKVALVHYWLVNMRGGEKVLEALAALFPHADIFTHVLDRERLSPALATRTIHTTFINALPRARHWYQTYLPLMPLALEELDLTDYDLVISSESGPAKGVITRPDATHLCYCHSPMRYIWDMYPDYRRGLGRIRRALFAPVAHYLRQYDVSSASRVDRFIANSTFVRARIEKFYRREATVIHPPVNTAYWSSGPKTEGEHYLFAGQLVPYKRADLAVTVCTELGLPLVVAGDGPECERLRSLAGKTVRFAGRVSDDELRRLMGASRALLFPGLEDFGLVPVEAMACGLPVIALGAGGALDTVESGVSGLLFDSQTPAALAKAVRRFEHEQTRFDPARIARHAATFDITAFNTAVTALVDRETRHPQGD